MSLQKLDILRVRNIQELSITPSASLNFIYGSNGSGKSSLLEAIFILGRACSFRTNSIKYVINNQASDLIVSGQALQKNGLYAQLGVQLSAKTCDIHINHQTNCKRAELAYALPIQLVHPLSYQLLDGSSANRREFMDWGIFNSDEHFLLLWRRYKKILMHRNALLKTKGGFRQIPAWDKELVHYAQIIAQYRADYIRDLQPIFLDICSRFLNFDDIELLAFPGWNDHHDLIDELAQSLEKDLRYGFTHFGPHRGDFYLFTEQRPVKDFISRGQLKLFVLALKLAQVTFLSQQFDQVGCILIDDFSAELDLVNRSKLLMVLSALNLQAYLTSNELDGFGDIRHFTQSALFRMEQGKIL